MGNILRIKLYSKELLQNWYYFENKKSLRYSNVLYFTIYATSRIIYDKNFQQRIWTDLRRFSGVLMSAHHFERFMVHQVYYEIIWVTSNINIQTFIHQILISDKNQTIFEDQTSTLAWLWLYTMKSPWRLKWYFPSASIFHKWFISL